MEYEYRPNPPALRPADFEVWIRRDIWRAAEFGLLLLEKEPETGAIPMVAAWFRNIQKDVRTGWRDKEQYAILQREFSLTMSLIEDAVTIDTLRLVQPRVALETVECYRFKPLDLVRFAVDKRLKVPAPLLALLEDEPDSAGIDTSGFSDELKIAIEAGQYAAGIDKPKGSYKQMLVDWLETNHPEIRSSAARERIATLVNPQKEGGSPGYQKGGLPVPSL